VASSLRRFSDAPRTPHRQPRRHAAGFDAIEFIVQTNPGQAAQPLRKIASGGELSRIMLALKGILAQSDRISVLVFDEASPSAPGLLTITPRPRPIPP
jgi:DNA repair ATPase RecN